MTQDQKSNFRKIAAKVIQQKVASDSLSWEFVLEQALTDAHDLGVERASNACDIDWPKGQPAQRIEYAAAESIKKRILTLKLKKGAL